MRSRLRKISLWFVSMIFAIVMSLSILSLTVFVNGKAFENVMTTTTTTNYSISQGVTLDKYIVRSAENKQSIGYMTTIDLTKDVKILATYTGYYTAQSTAETRKENAEKLKNGEAWAMSQTTHQAAAYDSIADKAGTVVMATNAGFFNLQTGKPSGYLIMEGNAITTGTEPFFAILKDGSAVIRDVGADISDVAEAVSGREFLIRNGEIVQPNNNASLAPRNSVGIKEDGTVVFFEFDGRQEPISAGLNLYELACMMKEAGCVDALNLDGGGSATVAARMEGTDSLELINSPSDGSERTISSGILVVSTAYPTGEFDHAVVSPDNELYTPGSTVEFSALGADPSGAPAPLPGDGLIWKLDTPEAGDMDSASGIFTASKDFSGTVAVHLEYEGKNVGDAEIIIAEPDEISFDGDSVSLDFNQESDLGLKVSCNYRTIHYKDGDFEWEIIPEGDYSAEAVGHIVDNKFIAGNQSDVSMRAEVRITYTNLKGEKLSDSIEVEIGKLPVVLIDFETQQKNGLDVGANSTWGNTYNWNNQAEKGISGYDPSARDGKGGFGNAEGTAVDPNGIAIPSKIEGELGVSACGDFVSGTGGNNCWHEAPYGWNCPQDPAALFRTMGYDWTVGGNSSSADGAYNMYAKRVNSENGEVRFGENSLEFHYDFTDITGKDNTNEYLIYTGEDINIEGSPNGIGMWIYAPEGTPNYWLMMYLAYWNGSGYTSTSFHFKTTAVNKAGETVDTTTQYTGINWSGWKYVEADISSIYTKAAEVSEEHPLKIMAGTRLLNIIIIEGGTPDVDGNKITCGARSAGSLYIDNIRAVYGTTVDDMDNPVIDSVKIGAADSDYTDLTELSEDELNVLTKNELQIIAEYHEYQGEYATGISEANTEILVDGKNIEISANKDQALGYITLPNGRHSVTVQIMDGFGNKTSVEYAFLVEAEQNDIPELDIEYSEEAVLGGNYTVRVSAESVENIDSVVLTINYGNIDKLDASTGLTDPRLTAAKVTYGEQFDATLYEHTVDKGETYITTNYYAERLTTTKKIVKMTATRKEGAKGSGDIILFEMPIPRTMTELDEVPISISVEYISGGETYTLSVPLTNYPVTSAYTIAAELMIAEGEAGKLMVKDGFGKTVAGAEIYLEDGTLLGTTDENGILETDYFVGLAAGTSTTIYAVKDNNYSFTTDVKTLAAGGDVAGLPSQIQLNATKDASETQNITWISNPLIADGKAVLEYSETKNYTASGKFDFSINGQTLLYGFDVSGSAVYINGVTLNGLTPGTQYSYRVGDGEHWSEVMTFTTSDPESRDTRFFVIGDTQLSGSLTEDADEIALMNAIAEQVNKNNPTFGIQTGDFVDNAGNLSQWTEILDVFTENYSDIPIVQVLGNHEYYGNTSGDIAAALWTLPDKNYYSVEYNDVYVAVINYAAELEEACAWLIEDAQKSECTWKVLAVHQPAYYTNPKGSSEAFNRYIPSAAEKAGINVVFSGHDHSYARTQPMLGGAVNEDGIVYYICGDLGEKSRGDEYTAVNNPDFNFAIISQEYTSVYIEVEANGYQMVITAYDVSEDGAEVLDSYTIFKNICPNNGHSYVYDEETGYLECENCEYYLSLKESYYTGWATDKTSARKMYFANGERYTAGDLLLDGKAYYFDENGFALNGEYTICGETCVIENGKFVGCENSEIVEAGYSGLNIEWVLYKDGTFKLGGSGEMKDYDVETMLPWYRHRLEMTTLFIGNQIDVVGVRAFKYCSITEIIFEKNSNLHTIGESAFQGTKLKKVVLPDSVSHVNATSFGEIIGIILVVPDDIIDVNSRTFNLSSDFIISVAPGSYAEEVAINNGWNYEVRNDTGIVEWNSGSYYYVNGVKTAAGLVKIGNSYYYADDSAKIIMDCEYEITKTNGYLPAGTYEFAPDGKMLFDGLVEESDGRYYYVDGVATEAGVIKIDGYYYYAAENGKLYTNMTATIEKTNDLLPEGTYEFASDGVILLNGIIELADGDYYFVDGKVTFAGLIFVEKYYTYTDSDGNEVRIKLGEYYNYFDESGKLVVNESSYPIIKTNGLLPSGNYFIDEDGKVLLHDYSITKIVAPTCTEKGYTLHICSICGDSYATDFVEAKGHTESEWIVDIEAGCSSEGLRHKECTECGAILETEKIQSAGHNYETTVIESTCTEKGYTIHTCTECGYSYSDTYVDAKGHTESEWITDKEATEESEGEQHKECTICHECLETKTLSKLGKKEASGGEIAAIVISVIAASGVIGVAAFLMIEKKRKLK